MLDPFIESHILIAVCCVVYGLHISHIFRDLFSGKEEDVELQPCSVVYRFTDLNEVKEQPYNSHCRPVSRAWPSVDFLRQPNEIVQVR